MIMLFSSLCLQYSVFFVMCRIVSYILPTLSNCNFLNGIILAHTAICSTSLASLCLSHHTTISVASDIPRAKPSSTYLFHLTCSLLFPLLPPQWYLVVKLVLAPVCSCSSVLPWLPSTHNLWYLFSPNNLLPISSNKHVASPSSLPF